MEKLTFHPGDRVVCVKAYGRYVYKNEEFTVETCYFNKNNDQFITTKQNSGFSMFAWRFKLVDQSTKYPTLNKEYFKKDHV